MPQLTLTIISMMNRQAIYIDTGAFIAKYLETDQYHKKSQVLWEGLIEKYRLYTSNFVVDELLTFLVRRVGLAASIKAAEEIYASRVLEILQSTREIEINAIAYMKKYKDVNKLSFTDCVSFSLCEDRNITEVFSFDHHFSIVGFNQIC